MMNSGLLNLFQAVLNLSLVGSYVILLVLLVRPALCKAPKWCSYLLWGIVFLRLICPVFPEAQFSLIPGGLSSAADVWMGADGAISDGQSAAQNGMGNTAEKEVAEIHPQGEMQNQQLRAEANRELQTQNPSAQVQNSQQNTTFQEGDLFSGLTANAQPAYIVSVLWLLGALLLAGYHTLSYWQLKRKVSSAKAVEPGVKEIPGEHLSFVMGVLHPTIYLAEGLDEESRRVVLCHESVHLQRRDYLTKPLTLAICCVHWFNPLVWLAFYLMNKDCEMSCDEKVVSLLGEESKKIYSYALLDEATKGESKYYRRKRACAFLSFGEENVKSRISHVLHYKKASLWIIIGAVLVLVVLIVGLCCNPGKESAAMDVAKELFLEEGGLLWGADATLWYELDCENDGRKEVFVEIGVEQTGTDQLAGDLWFVSDEGEATLLLEDKCFYRWEPFVSHGRELPLFSYIEDEKVQTEVYGVRQNKAELMMSARGEKYVDGDVIVYIDQDTRLEYDINSNSFSGYDEKEYTCYYDGANIRFYDGYKLTREEVTNYKNGEEILKGLEAAYPQAQFEYIARENNLLHVNMAYLEKDIVKFRYATYGSAGGTLTLLEEGPGCYRRGIELFGGTTFVEQVAKDYGWQEDSVLAAAQMTAEGALNRFAEAFAEREGNVLYELSSDKESFEKWDMVIPLEIGGYTFGGSSPWPASGDYVIDYAEGSEEAVIRFIMSNSAPEKYVALEKVRLAKQGALYYVNHEAFKMYDSIETRAELAEIFDLDAAVPFDSISTGYKDSFANIIRWHIWNETNPEYYSIYTDPVTSAKKMLHLGEGSGEVTGQLNGVANVRYTFAKDGSTVDIPMILADEAENVWVLYDGEVSQLEAAAVGGLTEEEKNIHGAANRKYILENPNTVMVVGNSVDKKTFVFIDMDGDGTTEEISIEQNPEGTYHYSPMDDYILRCGEGFEYRDANRLDNEIYAFSPDGERIFIALYEDGPSGDPLTTIFKYEDNRLHEAGEFDNDIVRNAHMENGVINTNTANWVIQTDVVRVQYILNEKGDLEQIPQEIYYYGASQNMTELHIELKTVLPVHGEPESPETFTIEPQQVSFVAVHHSMEWVLVEAENGQQGWIHVKSGELVDLQMSINEVFEGLYIAG